MSYDHKQIEAKWQKKWEESDIYKTNLESQNPFYNLMMFPYPSAEGLHIGSVYTFSGVDTFGRFKRMKGSDVFEPFGLDGFGIHSENYAFKIGEHIRDVSKRTEKHFYEQMKWTGNMYDWGRTVETYKPNYYKWTQWLFVQFFKAGLAYRKKSSVNWCPGCKTVLSDEQVIDGKCERSGDDVTQKDLEQWFFKITDYSKRLLENLEWIDWDNDVKVGQKNWIGKSEGAIIKFQIANLKSQEKLEALEIFTTRPDTLPGATFLVIAPENKFLDKIKDNIENWDEILAYREQTKGKSQIERTDLNKDKTGVQLKNLVAINPMTGAQITLWVADFALNEFGTGALFADAHDERDFEFALKYDLPLKSTVMHPRGDVYMGFVKKEWSRNFERFVEGLDKIGAEYLNKTKSEVLFFVKADKLEEFFEIAKESVMENAWHDVVGKRYYMIMQDKVLTVEKFEKNSEVFEIQKQLQPSVAKFKNLWDMLYYDSPYKEMVCMIERGILYDSGDLDGLHSDEAIKKVLSTLEEKNIGRVHTSYKLRDWCVSRQRYWGPPIPMIYCSICNEKHEGYHAETMPGWWPVEEKNLPVLLPDIENYEDILPDGSGQGPLEKQKDFMNVTCPQCGSPARRETDVSDPFVDSCWYFLRYPFTEYDNIPFGGNFLNNPKSLFTPEISEEELEKAKERMKNWLPVDYYIGGKEHTVLHLLYARFITMVFSDLGYIDFEEPFSKFYGHGLITKDGAKMSKSKGNIINPDEYYEMFGADAVRLYLRFLGPFDQGGDWRDTGMKGMKKFVNKIWEEISKFVLDDIVYGEGLDNISKLHQSIKGVGEDIGNLKYNTAVSKIMELVNWYKENQMLFNKQQTEKIVESLTLMLAPLTPHIAEEIWEKINLKRDPNWQWSEATSVHVQKWPEFDPSEIQESSINLPVQINGKMRGSIEVSKGITQDELVNILLQDARFEKYNIGSNKKIIFVQDKIINIIV